MERPAGNLELYSAWRNVLGYMPMVVVSATYSQPLTKPVLYRALIQLIEKEPLLRVNLFTHDKKFVLRQLPEFDLDDIVEFVDETDLDALTDLDAFVGKRIFDDTRDRIAYDDASKPTWRLYILGGTQAVWAFDHALFDGNSGAAFHRLLLAELEALGSPNLEDRSYPSRVSVPAGELPGSLEELVDLSLPWHYKLKVLWGMLLDWYRGPTRWTGPPTAVPFKSKTLFVDLDATSTAKLLAKARLSKVSLTALLTAALAHALMQLLPLDSLNREVSMSCPIDARRYLQAPGAFGNYVYAHDYTFDPLPKSENDGADGASRWILAAAAKYSPQLAHAVHKSKEPSYLAGLLDYIDIKEYLHKTATTGRRRVLGEISNLGAITTASGAWAITGMAFAQAASSLGAAFILSLVSVNGGALTLSISVAADDDARSQCFELQRLLLVSIHSLID